MQSQPALLPAKVQNCKPKLCVCFSEDSLCTWNLLLVQASSRHRWVRVQLFKFLGESKRLLSFVFLPQVEQLNSFRLKWRWCKQPFFNNWWKKHLSLSIYAIKIPKLHKKELYQKFVTDRCKYKITLPTEYKRAALALWDVLRNKMDLYSTVDKKNSCKFTLKFIFI